MTSSIENISDEQIEKYIDESMQTITDIINSDHVLRLRITIHDFCKDESHHSILSKLFIRMIDKSYLQQKELEKSVDEISLVDSIDIFDIKYMIPEEISLMYITTIISVMKMISNEKKFLEEIKYVFKNIIIDKDSTNIVMSVFDQFDENDLIEMFNKMKVLKKMF